MLMYELGVAIRQRGVDRVAAELGVDKKRIRQVRDSGLHHAKGVQELLRCPPALFDDLLNRSKPRPRDPAPPPALVAARELSMRIEAVTEAIRERRGDRRVLLDCKGSLLAQLAKACREEGWPHGVQPCRSTGAFLAFFELPNVGQVSWHCRESLGLPPYLGKWDGVLTSRKLARSASQRGEAQEVSLDGALG